MYWCNVFDNNLFFKCLLPSYMFQPSIGFVFIVSAKTPLALLFLGENLYMINCVLFVWKCYHTFIFEEYFAGNGKRSWQSFLSALCNTIPLFSVFLVFCHYDVPDWTARVLLFSSGSFVTFNHQIIFNIFA